MCEIIISTAYFYDCSNYSWLRTQETLNKARKHFEDLCKEHESVRLIVTKNKWTDEPDGFWIRLSDEPLGDLDVLMDCKKVNK